MVAESVRVDQGQPSRRKGAIGEKLVAGWCAARDINVLRSPDAKADRIFEEFRTEIKFSTLWANRSYKAAPRAQNARESPLTQRGPRTRPYPPSPWGDSTPCPPPREPSGQIRRFTRRYGRRGPRPETGHRRRDRPPGPIRDTGSRRRIQPLLVVAGMPEHNAPGPPRLPDSLQLLRRRLLGPGLPAGRPDLGRTWTDPTG